MDPEKDWMGKASDSFKWSLPVTVLISTASELRGRDGEVLEERDRQSLSRASNLGLEPVGSLLRGGSPVDGLTKSAATAGCGEQPEGTGESSKLTRDGLDVEVNLSVGSLLVVACLCAVRKAVILSKCGSEEKIAPGINCTEDRLGSDG